MDTLAFPEPSTRAGRSVVTQRWRSPAWAGRLVDGSGTCSCDPEGHRPVGAVDLGDSVAGSHPAGDALNMAGVAGLVAPPGVVLERACRKAARHDRDQAVERDGDRRRARYTQPVPERRVLTHGVH